MKKLFKTLFMAVFTVVVKLATVTIMMAAMLSIFVGGWYLIYMAIDLTGYDCYSNMLAVLHLLGGVCVLILIIPVYLRIWNVLEEKIS